MVCCWQIQQFYHEQNINDALELNETELTIEKPSKLLVIGLLASGMNVWQF